MSCGAGERSAGDVGAALRQVGPGLILAASIVGTGELIATTNLGAKVGFALLWLVIVSCFIKVFAQIELGRHAICTGQTTFAAFRELPGLGKLLGAWWIIMMLSTQLQLASMVGERGAKALALEVCCHSSASSWVRRNGSPPCSEAKPPSAAPSHVAPRGQGRPGNISIVCAS